MSKGDLIDYLRSVAPVAEAIARQESGPQYPELEFPEEIRSKVEKLLGTIPEFADLPKKMLRAVSWTSSISFFRLAISILERLSLRDDPNQIIDDLVDLAARKSASTFYLAGIGGIALSKAVRLTDQISIVTASDLAPSSAR